MSKHGATTSAREFATDVWFDELALHVVLDSGSELSAPLAAYPRLRDASPADRAEWRLIGRGEGIHWPTLDEDLSVAGLRKAI